MTTGRSDPPRVSLVALRQQYEQLKGPIDAAIASVVSRSAFIGGSDLEEFEQWFAAFCGVQHAIGVASGTAALELVMRARGIGRGDEVIAPVNTFVATAAAVATVGAVPVLVDVDERTGSLDVERVRAALTTRTKAIIAVHLYGRPASVHELVEIGPDVAVVEDAAQAHGARSGGRRVGSLSLAGCFSFYPTKNLGAFGDAGLVTTNDRGLADSVRLLRDHGRVSHDEHAIVGQTARLDNLQAAVLRVQADCLDEWNTRRRQAAAWYRQFLPDDLVCPDRDLASADADRGIESVYHLFVVRVPERDAFRTYLRNHGIVTAVHYPTPVHLQPAFRHLGYRPGDFPAAERLAREIVSLPMHPFLTRSDVQYVADVAGEFFRLSHHPRLTGLERAARE